MIEGCVLHRIFMWRRAAGCAPGRVRRGVPSPLVGAGVRRRGGGSGGLALFKADEAAVNKEKPSRVGKNKIPLALYLKIVYT